MISQLQIKSKEVQCRLGIKNPAVPYIGLYTRMYLLRSKRSDRRYHNTGSCMGGRARCSFVKRGPLPRYARPLCGGRDRIARNNGDLVFYTFKQFQAFVIRDKGRSRLNLVWIVLRPVFLRCWGGGLRFERLHSPRMVW